MKSFSQIKDILSRILAGFIFIIIIVMLVLAISNLIVSNKQERANDKAQTIYIAAERWVSDAQTKSSLKSDRLSGDTFIFRNSGEGSVISLPDAKNGYNQMDLTDYINGGVGGNWCVVIDKATLTVSYSLWSEKAIPDDKIKNPDKTKPQTFFSDWDNIIGSN